MSIGCREEVFLARFCKVRYRIVAVTHESGKLVITPTAVTQLPAMILVAKSNGLPLHLQDGQAVGQIAAGVLCAPDKPLVVSFRSKGLGPQWQGRLFLVNSNDRKWYQLVPDV